MEDIVDLWTNLRLHQRGLQGPEFNVHPKMTVRDFIDDVSKEWDVEMVENFVYPKWHPFN